MGTHDSIKRAAGRLQAGAKGPEGRKAILKSSVFFGASRSLVWS